MKKIDVAESIGELLYERDSVIIPGLGGFASTYEQAGIDHVQGLLHPPSKELDFNDNLSMNDGVLIHYLEEKYQIGKEEAKLAVEDFVDKTRQALKAREIVVFPRIGRLYQDFEQNFKFLQDNTNFNSESFGLPTVQFYPVVRYQKSATREIRTAAVTESLRKSMRGNSGLISRWFQSSMTWIILLSILIITLSIYFINKEPRAAGVYREELPSDRVNTAPERLPVQEETIIVDEPEDEYPDDPEEEIEETNDEDMPEEDQAMLSPDRSETETRPERPRPKKEADTDAPTLNPGMDSGVIIIGAFRDVDNAEKLIEEVYGEGYDAYSDISKGATRVGVRVVYNSEAELERKLAIVRDLFNEKAWILN
ncbi:MAG: SPOR domain-containing protein [Bacteroidetes bacterium]|nr:SPOR domain-containing protein [Bacteroidota bacterium]